jgi:GxxExxY protein
MEFSELSNRVIGCAIEVQRKLGPGLLESAYEQCLAHELSLHGITFKIQHPLPVEYKGVRLDCGYRVDVLVENRIILSASSHLRPHQGHQNPQKSLLFLRFWRPRSEQS